MIHVKGVASVLTKIERQMIEFFVYLIAHEDLVDQENYLRVSGVSVVHTASQAMFSSNKPYAASQIKWHAIQLYPCTHNHIRGLSLKFKMCKKNRGIGPWLVTGEFGSLIVLFSRVKNFRKLDCSLKLIVSSFHFIPKLLEIMPFAMQKWHKMIGGMPHLPDVQAVVDLKCEVRRTWILQPTFLSLQN